MQWFHSRGNSTSASDASPSFLKASNVPYQSKVHVMTSDSHVERQTARGKRVRGGKAERSIFAAKVLFFVLTLSLCATSPTLAAKSKEGASVFPGKGRRPMNGRSAMKARSRQAGSRKAVPRRSPVRVHRGPQASARIEQGGPSGESSKPSVRRIWPEHLLGDSVPGPFVGEIQVKPARVCAQLGAQVSFSQLLGGKDVTPAEARAALSQSRRKLPPRKLVRQRAVLLVPDGGIGNSLMSAEIGMSYAFLSGRRLLQYLAGSDGEGFVALCQAFHCAMANMPVMGHEKGLKRLFHIEMPQWAGSLHDWHPLILDDAHSVLGDMRADSRPMQCVRESFQCGHDDWCLHSKQLRLFIPMPSLALAEVIDKAMELRDPNMGNEHVSLQELHRWKDLQHHAAHVHTLLSQHSRETLQDPPATAVPKGKPRYTRRMPASLHLEFDVALHIRTLSRCVEGDPFARGCQSKSLEDAVAKAQGVPALRRFVNAQDWSCMLGLVLLLAQHKQRREDALGRQPGAPPEEGAPVPPLFPATKDDEALLRLFLGGASPGTVQGTWTIGDSIALARGNVSSLVGGQHSGTGDTSNQSRPGPRPARVLGSSTGEPYQSRDESSAGEKGLNSEDSFWNERNVRRRRLVQGADERGTPPNLRIFLATDSEALRPLFVEFLRPFGTVVHSKTVVAHMIAHVQKGASNAVTRKEHKVLLDAKVATMAEFFLLSKAAVVLGMSPRVSSFVREAATYGNVTLIHKEMQSCSKACCLHPLHFGAVP